MSASNIQAWAAIALGVLVLAVVSIFITYWYITIPIILAIVALIILYRRRTAPARAARAQLAIEEAEQRKRDAEVELLARAMRLVIDTQSASRTMLQRELRIGVSDAATILMAFEQRGIVSPMTGGGRRRVLLTPAEFAARGEPISSTDN